MLKVMLVDDEVQVIRGMRASVDWSCAGCEVVCEAVNGRDGIEKAVKFKPDIIITDITMPGMDGIEMSERLRDLLPEARIIFLTCHEDFYYARQALKLNISEYLVKETMTREELYETLKKAGREIKMEKADRDKAEVIIREFDDNRTLVGESIINDLIEGCNFNFSEIERRLDFYNYRLKDRHYLLSLLKLERNINSDAENDNGKTNFYKSNIFNTVREILKEHYCGEIFVKSKEEFVLVYYFPEPAACMEQRVYGISEQILQSLKIKIRRKCTIYIGDFFRSLQELPHKYKELKRMEERRFYLNDGTILTKESSSFPYKDDMDLRNKFLNDYRNALEALEADTVNASVTTFVDRSLRLKLPMGEVRNTFQRAFDTMIGVLEKYGQEYGNLSPVPYVEIVRDAADIYLLADALMDFSLKSIGLSRKSADFSASSEIQKVIRYIDRHLDDNLTLDLAASLANMNSSYFSRYFKMKTGEKFVDYLNRVRVEKAKSLLQDTYMTLDEILLKVGHVNKGYFIKVFKKSTGMSPGEYGRSKKNAHTSSRHAF